MCLAWHQPWCLLSCFKSIPAWILWFYYCLYCL
jgi:hypothetical protein